LLIVALPLINPLAVIAKVVAVTFAIHALVTAAASRGRHYAWVVFLAIAILAWFAV
jgi:hypothetical protein